MVKKVPQKKKVSPKKKHLIILFNPSSRVEQAQQNLMNIINKLSVHNILFHFIQTENEKHLRELSRKYATSTILGIGGDSTITIIAQEVLQELSNKKSKAKPKIAMIGTGSSNDLMLDYGLTDVDQILLAIKGNQWRTIDIGEITMNQQKYIFLGQCNFGLGVFVNRKVEQWKSKKRFWSKWQTFSGITAVIQYFISRQKSVNVRYTIEEGKKLITFEKKAIIFLVSKIRYWATGKLFVPNASLKDKKIHNIVVEKMGFWSFLKMTIQSTRGKHLLLNKVQYNSGYSINIDCTSSDLQAVQLDGDIIKDKKGKELMTNHFEINCLANKIQIPKI